MLEVFDLFYATLYDKTAHTVVEFGSFEAHAFIVELFSFDDVANNSDGLGSNKIVASNHSYSDTSSLDLQYGSRHFLSDDIHDTENANQSKVGLLDVFNFLRFRELVSWAAFIRGDVFVGKADSSQCLFGVLIDDCVEVLLHAVVHGLNVAVFIKVLAAAVFYNFRSTLHHKTFVVSWLGFGDVVQNCTHSLTF